MVTTSERYPTTSPVNACGWWCLACRPDGQQWLKFDDEKVEKAEGDKAVQENWGGEGEHQQLQPAPGEAREGG